MLQLHACWTLQGTIPEVTVPSWQVFLQIGSLSVGQEAETHFVQLYVIFMNQLVTVLPITADIPKAYQQGSDDEQEFVQNLAIFLTGFLKVQTAPLPVA